MLQLRSWSVGGTADNMQQLRSNFPLIRTWSDDQVHWTHVIDCWDMLRCQTPCRPRNRRGPLAGHDKRTFA